MPSRRRFVATLGAAVLGSATGCASTDTTTGTVTRKHVTVAVPRRGDPVDASVALLAFEPDRGLVHGEYDPEHAGSAVDEGTLSVSTAVHDALQERFAAVTYSINVVPADVSTPANGLMDREAFNRASLGATATVASFVGADGVGRLSLRDVTPPDQSPERVTVTQFDLDARLA